MSEFNVINYDFNSKQFCSYNIIPYLVRCYEETDEKPTTVEEFKEFIEHKSMYQWWSRCEYEIILLDWPCQKTYKKIDIHWQVMMNINIIVKLLMEELCK